MARMPSKSGTRVVKGHLGFEFSRDGYPTIVDIYNIRIEITQDNRIALPSVTEVGGRIPRDQDHHVNHDGTLCLGSPFALQRVLGMKATLVTFVEKCVIPFLYAASWRERGNQGYPFGELAHGRTGLLHDYEQSLKVKGEKAVCHALGALARRRRVANKLPCPCGCGSLLSRCPYRDTINAIRSVGARSTFLHLWNEFGCAKFGC